MSRLPDLIAKFNGRVQRYRKCCTTIEEELLQRRLNITNVRLVYCASFLSVCSQWEALLEHILYEAVCGPSSGVTGNYRYVSVRNRSKLQKILLYPNKQYLSLSSVNRAESLTSLFVNDGRPISAVSERNRTLLEQATFIRNAIAHESEFAKQRFRESVPGVIALPPSKRVPGAFLRHVFRQQPVQRRYEIYFGAYQSAAIEIASAW